MPPEGDDVDLNAYLGDAARESSPIRKAAKEARDDAGTQGAGKDETGKGESTLLEGRQAARRFAPNKPAEESEDLDEDKSDRAGKGAGDESDKGSETGEDDDEQEEGKGTDDEQGGDEEDEDEEEGDAAKGEGHSVEIPTVQALESNGEKGTVLELTGLPQEFADEIRAHLKRSARLNEVQAQVQELEQSETVATFFESHPLSGMHWIEKEQPETAKKFVESWMLRHPADALATVKSFKLDSADKELLAEKAKNAQREAEDAIGQGVNGITEQRSMRQFANMAAVVLDDLAGRMQLSGQDREEFIEYSRIRITKASQARQQAGQSRVLSKQELLNQIQPVVKRFLGHSLEASDQGANGKGKGKGKTKGKDGKADLDRRAAITDRMQRSRGGGSTFRGAGTQRKTAAGSDLASKIAEYKKGR